MQKIRPDMDIGKNIQTIRYANKLTQSRVKSIEKVQKVRQTCQHYLQEELEICQNRKHPPGRKI